MKVLQHISAWPQVPMPQVIHTLYAWSEKRALPGKEVVSARALKQCSPCEANAHNIYSKFTLSVIIVSILLTAGSKSLSCNAARRQTLKRAPSLIEARAVTLLNMPSNDKHTLTVNDDSLLHVSPRQPGKMLNIVEEKMRSEIAANKPKIQPTERSPLLSRMAAFLPTIQAANATLDCNAPSTDAFVLEEQQEDVEHTNGIIQCQSSSDASSDDGDEPSCRNFSRHDCRQEAAPRIEMDLMCGVLDLQNKAACSAAEATIQDGQSIEEALDKAADTAPQAHRPQTLQQVECAVEPTVSLKQGPTPQILTKDSALQ